MKKTLLLTLLLAFVFLTCKEDKPVIEQQEEKQELPTLDKRLIGGRWYFPKIDNADQPISNGYYEFKEDWTFIYSDSSNNLTQFSVYSKDGVVYRKDNNKTLLQYQFYTSFPYQDIGVSGSNLSILNKIAADNNLMTCDAFDRNMNLYYDYEDYNYQFKFLRRFKENKTPYEY